MRFKDFLGRKPEPDESTGRLVTAPVPAAPIAPAHRTAPVAPGHRTAPVAPVAPAPPAPAPPHLRTSAPDSLADAFARLLAAEQGEPPPPAPLPARLSDEDVERISARVAARFAEGPLRTDVQRIVAEVAERLVREEIARIRRDAESQQP